MLDHHCQMHGSICAASCFIETQAWPRAINALLLSV